MIATGRPGGIGLAEGRLSTRSQRLGIQPDQRAELGINPGGPGQPLPQVWLEPGPAFLPYLRRYGAFVVL